MMTIKRLLFRTAVRFLESLVMAAPSFRKLNLDKVAKVDICTVAFNNLDLIKYQHRLLKKFVQDKFQYVIIDNSIDKSKSEAIYDFCLAEGISYVKVPRNLLNAVGVSYSHATAVNYFYRRILKKRNPNVFVILDHDMFPIKPVKISSYLKDQPFYGPIRRRGRAWYPSAILNIFNYKWTLAAGRFDFMPVAVDGNYLDTGGGNWFPYYSKMDTNSLTFPTDELEQFREGDCYHGDYFEFLDNRIWLHTINGSCWKKPRTGNSVTFIHIWSRCLERRLILSVKDQSI